MELFKKFYWLITPFLIVLFMYVIEHFFHMKEIGTNTAIAVSLAYLLSPRVKIVQKQHGEEEQIKWLFFKKVINKKI